MNDVALLGALSVAAAVLWSHPITIRRARAGAVEGSLGGAPVVVMAMLFGPLEAIVCVAVTAVAVSWFERDSGSAAAANVIGRLAQVTASTAVVAMLGRPVGLGAPAAVVATAATAAQLSASLVVITVFFSLRDGSHPLLGFRSPTRADWTRLLVLNTSLVLLAMAAHPSPFALGSLVAPVFAIILGVGAANDAGRSRAALATVADLMPKAIGPDPLHAVESSLEVTARTLLGCDRASVTDTPPLAGMLAAPFEIDGHLRWLVADGTSRRFLDEDRRLLEAVAATAATLLTAARRTAAITEAADHDALTGVLNRRGFERRVAQTEMPITIAVIDVDDMKRINDTFGHPAGDEVLREVARLLRQGRDGDIVCRWGGEEFVVALDCDPDGGRSWLQRVLVDARTSGEGALSFSAGVTSCMSLADLDDAVARADAALYDAKRSGKGRVVTAG